VFEDSLTAVIIFLIKITAPYNTVTLHIKNTIRIEKNPDSRFVDIRGRMLWKVVIAGHYPRDNTRIGKIPGKYLEHGYALERSRGIAVKNITANAHLVNVIANSYLKHFFKSVALYPHPLLMGGIHAGRNRIPQM
jgi:hypothetical protein